MSIQKLHVLQNDQLMPLISYGIVHIKVLLSKERGRTRQKGHDRLKCLGDRSFEMIPKITPILVG